MESCKDLTTNALISCHEAQIPSGPPSSPSFVTPSYFSDSPRPIPYGMTERICSGCEPIVFYHILTIHTNPSDPCNSQRLILHRVLEVNTGLICSCTVAFKPFFKYLASKRMFSAPSPDSIPHRKTTVPSGKRTYTARLTQQEKEGSGFIVLKDDDIEMSRLNGALEVGHAV